MSANPDSAHTVNLDLGNAAELNMVAINPAHITHVRLSGALRADSRKMDIHLTDGTTIAMSFDDAVQAEQVFDSVRVAVERVLP